MTLLYSLLCFLEIGSFFSLTIALPQYSRHDFRMHKLPVYPNYPSNAPILNSAAPNDLPGCSPNIPAPIAPAPFPSSIPWIPTTVQSIAPSFTPYLSVQPTTSSGASSATSNPTVSNVHIMPPTSMPTVISRVPTYTIMPNSIVPTIASALPSSKPYPIEFSSHPQSFPTSLGTSLPTAALSPSNGLTPTMSPSALPSIAPSIDPLKAPSMVPSIAPSMVPLLNPSIAPSITPSIASSTAPSIAPSIEPSKAPSMAPSIAPTIAPLLNPSIAPSITPSITSSTAPSKAPSIAPFVTPLAMSPSMLPSTLPIVQMDNTATPTIKAPSESPAFYPVYAVSANPTALIPSMSPVCNSPVALTCSPTLNPIRAPDLATSAMPTDSIITKTTPVPTAFLTSMTAPTCVTTIIPTSSSITTNPTASQSLVPTTLLMQTSNPTYIHSVAITKERQFLIANVTSVQHSLDVSSLVVLRKAVEAVYSSAHLDLAIALPNARRINDSILLPNSMRYDTVVPAVAPVVVPDDAMSYHGQVELRDSFMITFNQSSRERIAQLLSNYVLSSSIHSGKLQRLIRSSSNSSRYRNTSSHFADLKYAVVCEGLFIDSCTPLTLQDLGFIQRSCYATDEMWFQLYKTSGFEGYGGWLVACGVAWASLAIVCLFLALKTRKLGLTKWRDTTDARNDNTDFSSDQIRNNAHTCSDPKLSSCLTTQFLWSWDVTSFLGVCIVNVSIAAILLLKPLQYRSGNYCCVEFAIYNFVSMAQLSLRFEAMDNSNYYSPVYVILVAIRSLLWTLRFVLYIMDSFPFISCFRSMKLSLIASICTMFICWFASMVALLALLVMEAGIRSMAGGLSDRQLSICCQVVRCLAILLSVGTALLIRCGSLMCMSTSTAATDSDIGDSHQQPHHNQCESEHEAKRLTVSFIVPYKDRSQVELASRKLLPGVFEIVNASELEVVTICSVSTVVNLLWFGFTLLQGIDCLPTVILASPYCGLVLHSVLNRVFELLLAIGSLRLKFYPHRHVLCGNIGCWGFNATQDSPTKDFPDANIAPSRYRHIVEEEWAI